MLFLSRTEAAEWSELGRGVMEKRVGLHDVKGHVRANLIPLFRFYAGALLAARHRADEAKPWFVAGASEEGEDLMSNAFIAGFLERQGGRLAMPEVVFADPRPFVHFTTVPAIRGARANFIRHCGLSLPAFRKPLRILDIGCGNGALALELLQHLRSLGKVDEVAEIMLVDSSPAMIELAIKTVAAGFDRAVIHSMAQRIEDVSDRIQPGYDVALSSLAYHHMPWEKKLMHMRNLRSRMDHFLLFELNANNDTPELYSPELAVSVYQSYGWLIDAVFAHDAPVAVAQSCVDRFLLPEEVSLLTQPRGERTEYHMLRGQWHALFREALGDDFTCWSDATAYSNLYFDLYTLHYGR